MKDTNGHTAKKGDIILVFTEINIDGHDVVSQSEPIEVCEDEDGKLILSDSGDYLSSVFDFEIIQNN